MPISSVVIAGVTTAIALCGILFRPRDLRWAVRLERPRWLFFEPAIPFIWTAIFICGAISAMLVWQIDPGSFKTWSLMVSYLLLEIVTVAYIPVTLRSRSLTVGTVLGGLGVLIGVLLFFTVLPISQTAALLLVPYILWTPIGTYTTRQMMNLNPEAT